MPRFLNLLRSVLTIIRRFTTVVQHPRTLAKLWDKIGETRISRELKGWLYFIAALAWIADSLGGLLIKQKIIDIIDKLISYLLTHLTQR